MAQCYVCVRQASRSIALERNNPHRFCEPCYEQIKPQLQDVLHDIFRISPEIDTHTLSEKQEMERKVKIAKYIKSLIHRPIHKVKLIVSQSHHNLP